MKLYEEVELIENAINDVLYSEEEYDQSVLDNLIQAKIDTITNGMETLCKIRARKEANIAVLKEEAKRMKDKADREEKSLERLEDYMLSMLKRSGEKKLSAGTFTVGTRTSTSVYVAPDFNDERFIRTTTTTAPDKVALKEALKAGETINGANLVEKENLAIK